VVFSFVIGLCLLWVYGMMFIVVEVLGWGIGDVMMMYEGVVLLWLESSGL